MHAYGKKWSQNESFIYTISQYYRCPMTARKLPHLEAGIPPVPSFASHFYCTFYLFLSVYMYTEQKEYNLLTDIIAILIV